MVDVDVFVCVSVFNISHSICEEDGDEKEKHSCLSP
jgi:hypothetical protein